MNESSLKQWHEENYTFYKELKLTFSQCDINKNITWAEILRLTTDYAGEDFSLRGLPWEFLKDEGIAIIVSRISFHVEKQLPHYGQKITIKTWESAPTGPLFTRNFEIYDTESNDLLISANTLWSIIDFENRKMVPAKTFTYRPTPTVVYNFGGIKPGKISIPEDIKTIGKHVIKYSELDANTHTNNSKYINFALDYLPAEYQSKVYKDVRLNYSKEVMLGDELEIKASINDAEKYIIVAGYSGDTSSFECQLYW